MDFWFRLLFKVKLLEGSGTAFQHLVNQVCAAAWLDFTEVAPWGSEGDRGNDGCIIPIGHYLQVYGPQLNSAWNPVDAAKKAKADFKKLKSHWGNISRYSFVLNDRFAGIPAPVLLTLQGIAADHSIECDSIGASKLTDLFMELPEDRKTGIVGGIPDNSPPFYDARALGELLKHLADNAIGTGLFSKTLAPDFDDKVAFNGLSDPLATRMRDRSYTAANVGKFLATRDQYLAQAIATEMRTIYAESRSVVGDALEEAPDLRYLWMIEQIIPAAAKGHNHTMKAYREAAEMVIAHYFEACDVYEQPAPSGGAT